MKEMWQTLKEYFGDGFVPGSAPLRYNIHCCDMRRPSTRNVNTDYIVEIGEDAMPLFSVLGDTCAPPCSCQDIQKLVKHIDDYLETASDRHVNDYTITSGKDDTNIDQVCLYVMRDVLSWWVHWGGTLCSNNYWKQVYVGFATIPDDLQLQPKDVLDGRFRFLGHTWPDCRAGLLSEGLTPAEVELAEMCLWRELITQYLEKVDHSLRPLLMSKTMLMTQYRVHTGNSLGCSGLLLASKGVKSRGMEDNALEVASIASCISMDMAKEALGVLGGEKTETVAGNRVQLKRELRWVYVRCMEYLASQPNVHALMKVASAGLHFVPMMDRYLERAHGNVRFPISEAMGRILEPFIKTQVEVGNDQVLGEANGGQVESKVNEHIHVGSQVCNHY